MELAPNMHGRDRARAEKNDAEMKSNRKWQHVYVSNEIFFLNEKSTFFTRSKLIGICFHFYQEIQGEKFIFQ